MEGGQNTYDNGAEPAPEIAAEGVLLMPVRRLELQAASVPVIGRTVFGAAQDGHPNELWR
jgi:hypothetical protein